jgi:hypothetical protein
MSQRDKPRQGVVANILNLFRNGVSLLAKAFGVGSSDWLNGKAFNLPKSLHLVFFSCEPHLSRALLQG